MADRQTYAKCKTHCNYPTMTTDEILEAVAAGGRTCFIRGEYTDKNTNESILYEYSGADPKNIFVSGTDNILTAAILLIINSENTDTAPALDSYNWIYNFAKAAECIFKVWIYGKEALVTNYRLESGKKIKDGIYIYVINDRKLEYRLDGYSNLSKVLYNSDLANSKSGELYAQGSGSYDIEKDKFYKVQDPDGFNIKIVLSDGSYQTISSTLYSAEICITDVSTKLTSDDGSFFDYYYWTIKYIVDGQLNSKVFTNSSINKYTALQLNLNSDKGIIYELLSGSTPKDYLNNTKLAKRLTTVEGEVAKLEEDIKNLNQVTEIADGSVTKEKLDSELNFKLGYLATKESDYTKVDNVFINSSGKEVSINNYGVYYYNLIESLDERTIIVTTKLQDSARIVLLDVNGNVLEAVSGTSMQTMTEYSIKVPSGTTKIGISRYNSNDIPTIELKELSSSSVRDIVINELQNPSNEDLTLEIDKSGGAFRIFHDIGVIGDSLSSGVLEYYNDGTTANSISNYDYSFGQCMARSMGVTVDNYSVGGATAKSINESTLEKITPLWTSKKQVYIIGLGTNDYFSIKDNKGTYTSGWGSAETDIDLENYNNNADSFIGWYAKIIQRVREVNPDCYLFLLPNPINTSADQLNAITNIATKFDRCFLIDTTPYISKWCDNYKLGWHLSPYGYLIYADYIMSLISKLILESESKFKNVGFIGTEYKNNNYD